MARSGGSPQSFDQWRDGALCELVRHVDAGVLDVLTLKLGDGWGIVVLCAGGQGKSLRGRHYGGLGRWRYHCGMVLESARKAHHQAAQEDHYQQWQSAQSNSD